jgi:hypothetical protein
MESLHYLQHFYYSPSRGNAPLPHAVCTIIALYGFILGLPLHRRLSIMLIHEKYREYRTSSFRLIQIAACFIILGGRKTGPLMAGGYRAPDVETAI